MESRKKKNREYKCTSKTRGERADKVQKAEQRIDKMREANRRLESLERNHNRTKRRDCWTLESRVEKYKAPKIDEDVHRMREMMWRMEDG